MRNHRRVEARAKVRRRPWPVIVIITLAVTAIVLALATVVRSEERTLDAVEIEGEVRLPQVLFITSREVDRPMDWLEHYRVSPVADGAVPIELRVLPALPREEVPGSVPDLDLRFDSVDSIDSISETQTSSPQEESR